jgi:hypothetical protein
MSDERKLWITSYKTGKAINQDRRYKVIMICVICGHKLEGYGNDPYPVKSEGRCCDKCNITKVIPARIKLMKEEVKKWKK